MKKQLLALAVGATLAGCASQNNMLSQQTPIKSLSLEIVGSYISGNEFDTSSAEIVSYDKTTDRLYVVNAEDKSIDVLGFDDQHQPIKTGNISLESAGKAAKISIGAANSVSAKNGLIAVAIENRNKQQNGIIALYRSRDLSLINTYPAGALPDMVTLTEDGLHILAANEGEPSKDYTIDPEGSVTLVDISKGTDSSKAVVKQIHFRDFNQGNKRYSELKDVRTPRPHGATVAQDLEPEYIALTDNGKAVVSLQENNALAVIDIASAKVEAIHGLGLKSWADKSSGGYGYQLDLTNKDGKFSRASYPQLAGYYMPDTIAGFSVNGQQYVISANEGDGREYIYESTQSQCESKGHQWDGDDFSNTASYTQINGDCISYTDETRGKKLKVDAEHPLMNSSIYGKDTIANGKAIGRVKVVVDNADAYKVAADETVKTFGARSFSIWTLDGEQVFDSGDQLSKLANNEQHFNTSNDGNNSDDRSDDKGVEPEAVEVAEINGNTIAFIGLERQGGIAAYDVSNPKAPVFLDYINNRDFTANVCTEVDKDGECTNGTYNPNVKDLGPESIEYFTRKNQHFIAVGNEVSGTTTVYKLNIL